MTAVWDTVSQPIGCASQQKLHAHRLMLSTLHEANIMEPCLLEHSYGNAIVGSYMRDDQSAALATKRRARQAQGFNGKATATPLGGHADVHFRHAIVVQLEPNLSHRETSRFHDVYETAIRSNVFAKPRDVVRPWNCGRIERRRPDNQVISPFPQQAAVRLGGAPQTERHRAFKTS